MEEENKKTEEPDITGEKQEIKIVFGLPCGDGTTLELGFGNNFQE